jgi:hypothetical protein
MFDRQRLSVDRMHEQDVRFQGFGQRQIHRIAVVGVAQYEPSGIGWLRRAITRRV